MSDRHARIQQAAIPRRLRRRRNARSAFARPLHHTRGKRKAMIPMMSIADAEGDVDVIESVETFSELFKVRAWTVLLYNDDFTPMNVVTDLLKLIFHMAPEAAEVVTMKVHNEGRCAIGAFDRDIAETKATLLVENARQLGYPLMAEAAPIE